MKPLLKTTTVTKINMKLFILALFLIGNSYSQYSNSFDLENSLNFKQSKNKDQNNSIYYSDESKLRSINQNNQKISTSEKLEEFYPTDDSTAEKIRDNIFLMAKKMMKESNLLVKKKMNGMLPDSYPLEMIRKGLKYRNEKSNWEKIMKNPTEVWGFCIYPKYKINAMSWCEQMYSVNNKEKIKDCKSSFCNVCCDHYPNILEDISSKKENKIGKLLMFDRKSGFVRISKYSDQNEIKKCRNECKRVYPVKLPMILPAPPRDLKLGKSPDQAARSCADIKKWGDSEAKSGEYWIDLQTKGKVVAYCDLETDLGGWTLFFNYVHKSSQEVAINSSKIPRNLSENSHILLKDTGLEENHIQEVRFYCTEQSKKNKLFAHFKTKSRDIIRTSYTGDQSSIKISSFEDNSSNLDFIGNSKSWTRSFDPSSFSSELDYVGSSNTGSFWNTPFGSSTKSKFWTVKNGRFECGSSHKDGLDDQEGKLVETQHSIWFRGPAPSDEEARVRYSARNFK